MLSKKRKRGKSRGIVEYVVSFVVGLFVGIALIIGWSYYQNLGVANAIHVTTLMLYVISMPTIFFFKKKKRKKPLKMELIEKTEDCGDI